MANYLILLQQDYYVRSGTVNNISLEILSVRDDGTMLRGRDGAKIVSATKDGGDYLSYFKWNSDYLRVMHPDSSTLISSELEAGVYTVEINGGYNSVFVNVHYMHEDFIACDDTCVLSGRFGVSSLPVQTGDDSKISDVSVSWIEKPSDMRDVEDGMTGGNTTTFSKSYNFYLRNWCYDEDYMPTIGGDNFSGAERIWKAVVSRGDASKTVTFTQEPYGNLDAEVIYSTPVIVPAKLEGYKPVYVEMALSNFPPPEYMRLESVESVDGEVSKFKLGFDYIKSNRFFAIICVKDDEVLSEGHHSVRMVLRNTGSRESVTVETSFKVAVPASDEYQIWDKDIREELVFEFDDQVDNPTKWDNFNLSESQSGHGSRTEPDNFYEGLPDFVYFKGADLWALNMYVKTAQMIEDEYVFPLYFYVDGVRYKSPVDVILRKRCKVRIHENDWLKRNAKDIYCVPRKSVPLGSKQYVVVDYTYTGASYAPAVNECRWLRHFGSQYQLTEVDVVVKGNTVTKTWEVTIPDNETDLTISGLSFVIGLGSDSSEMPSNEIQYITTNDDFYVNFPAEVRENQPEYFNAVYHAGTELTFEKPDDVLINITGIDDMGDGRMLMQGTILVKIENNESFVNVTVSDGTVTTVKTIAVVPEEIPLAIDMPKEVQEETDYQITITYPTGSDITLNYPDGVNITLGEAVDSGKGITTVTGTLRVDEEYEDDTAYITISDGEVSITKKIRITEKEITMPNPTITFQRGFDLTFPQTGATRDITVVYEYTTEGRINDPYSSVWGVNITKGEPVVSGDSITVTYSISVPATTYAIDAIPLIFSCVGVNGSSCTETLYGNQEGTSRDNGDECYVKLDSYAHVFPSSGGTFYVTADFCKPVVGEGLSVRVMNSNGVYPISWCKAELKGGGIDDDGFEGHENWVITMNGSDITEPFTALIIFSYTNSYGESASATFTAIREASAGEPETFDPEIQPYSTQLRFKADGSNDIQNMDYLHVMYQDFATGVINNPISDVGWFRIVETVKQEETEDGILMRYYYEVDVNELTVPRTGELNLSGVVAGVQYSTSVTLTQARAETTDDDGDDDDGDDTGDIPIIEGTYIGQIWKDVEFDFGTQNPVSYTIWMGDEMIYSGKSYMRPGQGSNKILVNKIVQDYLVQPQLDLDVVTWYVNGKEFTLRNADGSRISHTYRFINDWSYSDDFKTGNLSHPILNKQRAVRGQMYPFSIYGAGEQVSIEYGVTYMDGFVDEFGREIEDWWSTEYITNGVSTDFFKVARRDVEWIESVTVGDDTYYPEEPCAIPYVIYYVNPWGGFDWFPVTGKVTIKDSLTQYSYTKNYNNTKLGFGNSRYLTSIDRKYEVNTGWMTQAESERMWYLLESNVVYLHDIKADKIYPVLIKDTEVEHKKRSGSQKLINYTFTCQLSHNRKRQ